MNNFYKVVLVGVLCVVVQAAMTVFVSCHSVQPANNGGDGSIDAGVPLLVDAAPHVSLDAPSDVLSEAPLDAPLDAPPDDCDLAERNLHDRQCHFSNGNPAWVTQGGKPFSVVCRGELGSKRMTPFQLACIVALVDCSKLEAAYQATVSCP